ncbi:unnamed protein product [Hydatigera taeniaeformis]|uniref:Uncharacterized protein n=1 Tax=Hydatigena taeniaeformis TaxID=6205 RepID=A0A0R3X8V3_HYDTA|nr:unnamed protein product [Hydatigera taeniaeformis]
MNSGRRVFCAPSGSSPADMPARRLQRSHHQSYQPVYVIQLGAAPAPAESMVVDQVSEARPISHPSVPTIAPKLDAPATSSPGPAKGKRPLLPLDDREMRRRVSGFR